MLTHIWEHAGVSLKIRENIRIPDIQVVPE